MTEIKKTIYFAGAAAVLLLLAIVTTPNPATPDQFSDVGTEFFPEFSDPNSATTLEVIDYDEAEGQAIAFKVTNRNGRWSIPSHHDYPADGKERLSKTAAGVIGIKRDDYRTDNAADYTAMGVIDPLDETAPAEGRGQRVTIKGENDKILADLIIGNKVEGDDKRRFVRLPEKKRVYAVNMEIDISTKFGDWIETDLLQVDKDKVNEMVFDDYSINEFSGSLDRRDKIIAAKSGSDWTLDRVGAGKEVDVNKVNDVLKTIDELNIVGVRVKPEGLSQSLSRTDGAVQITSMDQQSLQSKGYFFTVDGSLVSNEGELQVRTEEGVNYTLRFGEVVFGSGLALTAGTGDGEGGDGGENRYLFITTQFDENLFPQPPSPANMDFQGKADSLMTDADRSNQRLYSDFSSWEDKVKKGRDLSQQLNERFAKWYYVIPQSAFDKLDIARADLLKDASPS